MRMLGIDPGRIAAFREAAEVHIALCGIGALPESPDSAGRALGPRNVKNC